MLSFAVVVGLLTLTPGIDTALVLRSSLTEGRRAAFSTLAGVSLGVLVWGVAAAVGISALLTASRLLYDVLRLAGAAYMIYLGAKLLWHSRAASGVDLPDAPGDIESDGRAHGAALASTHPPRLRGAFARGFLTNVLNPKVGVFYVAILPQFLPHDVPAALGGLLLALVHFVEGWAWLSLLILATQAMRSWLARPKVERWIDRVTGLVLIGFSVRVATDWS
jgi:threonine/homoserine/homoserine lactone efflux protein